MSDEDIARRYRSSIDNLQKAISIVNIAHVYNSNGGTRRLFSARNGVIKKDSQWSYRLGYQRCSGDIY